MRAERLSWPKVVLAGLLIGVLAIGVIRIAQVDDEDEGRSVDAGSYEEFVNAGIFPPILFARDSFYLVKTEVGEPKALYVYPPVAQVHERPGCAVTWQEMGQDGGPAGGESSSGVFRDPCFGATFTRDGDWVSGPSSRGLDQSPVEVKNGRILVDTGRLICDAPGSCNRL